MIGRDYGKKPPARPQATTHHVTERVTPHATYTLRRGVVIGKRRSIAQRLARIRDAFRRNGPIMVRAHHGVEMNDTPLEFGSHLPAMLKRQAD